MSFKRVFYDYKTNKIHHWFLNAEGKTHREEVPFDLDCYVPDNTGKSDINDIYGNPVILQKCSDRDSFKQIKENFNTCEATINPEIKFLQKTYAGKDLKLDLDKFQIATVDIEVNSKDKTPFEGARDVKKAIYPINLISVHLSKTNEVYTFGLHEYTGTSELVKNYNSYEDEKTLIESFIQFMRKAKVDIYTGWSIRLFDIPYIIHRCINLKITASLSPVDIYKEKQKSAGYHIDGGGYEIGGTSILDGLDLYKNFEKDKRETYSLDFIGKLVVGEGKIKYEGELSDLSERDWNQFVEYNIQDVLLAKKINDKTRYIELTINFCYKTLVPFEKIFSSINLVTGYILRFLHEKNTVVPDRKHSVKEELPGAYVMAKEGYHEHIMNFDVESMYPHMIIRYNISPETLVLNPTNTEGLISTPVEGVYYRKDIEGVFPKIVTSIFNERKYYKTLNKVAEGLESGLTEEKISSNYRIPIENVKTAIEEIKKDGGTAAYYFGQQHIRKILMNSIYGDISNEYFIFYNNNNAKVITLGGQSLIKFLSTSVNEYIRKYINKIMFDCFGTKCDIQLDIDPIILIDTDSNYFCFDEIITKLGITFPNNEAYRDWCNTINTKFFEPFFDKIIKIYFKRYNIDKSVNFRKEKIITKMFILAKKKYAAEVVDTEGKFHKQPKISITGIEIVRTDTPAFCRTRIKNIIEEIFNSKDKDKVIEKMKFIKNEFLNADITDIGMPTGIKEYSKYGMEGSHYVEHGLSIPKGCPIHARASINYNYIIEKHKLPLMPIYDGAKMKFAYVAEKRNELNQNVIGFIGKWPDSFNKLFYVDKEKQWEVSFESTIQRFFDVLKWGKISYERNSLEDYIC